MYMVLIFHFPLDISSSTFLPWGRKLKSDADYSRADIELEDNHSFLLCLFVVLYLAAIVTVTIMQILGSDFLNLCISSKSLHQPILLLI